MRYAGYIAAAVFVLWYFVLGLGLIVGAILSGLVYVALGTALLPAVTGAFGRRNAAARTTRTTANEPDLTGSGITHQELTQALTDGARKLTQLKRATDRVRDDRVRAKANAVCDAVARIITDVREDPKDLRGARKFLNYYLDAAINVVKRYVDLRKRGASTAEAQAALSRAESSLETIRAAYERQLQHLLENDLMDLDTELEVLERTIKLEGLGGTDR